MILRLLIVILIAASVAAYTILSAPTSIPSPSPPAEVVYMLEEEGALDLEEPPANVAERWPGTLRWVVSDRAARALLLAHLPIIEDPNPKMLDERPPDVRKERRVERREPRRPNICVRHGMRKVFTNGGRSWRCRK